MTDSASPAEERPDIEVLTDADGVVIGYAAHSPEGVEALLASPAEERPLTLEQRRAFVNFVRLWWSGPHGFPVVAAGNDSIVEEDFEDMAAGLAKIGLRLASVTDDERLDPERLADMAVMSLGEVTSVTVYGDIHRQFRARFAARVRRAEYERLRR